MIFWLQNPQTCVLCGRWILVKPMVLYYTWDSVSRPLASMYMAKDSRVFVFSICTGPIWHRIMQTSVSWPFVSMYRAKDSRVVFFFIMYKFLHYAYVTGSCKPTICVNNMDRAVDLRVRLVIPSNYPQGTVFLSSRLFFYHIVKDLRQVSLCTGPSLCTWHRIMQTCATMCVNNMHRAVDPRVPPGHSLDPMHRAQFS